MAPVLVPLRPSSEHILIVRAPGARDQHGCHSILFIVGALRARRTVCLLPRILLRPRVARAQGTHRAIPSPAGGLFQYSARNFRATLGEKGVSMVLCGP